MGSQAKAKEVRAAKKQAARARKQRGAERAEQRKGAAFQPSGKPRNFVHASDICPSLQALPGDLCTFWVQEDIGKVRRTLERK